MVVSWMLTACNTQPSYTVQLTWPQMRMDMLTRGHKQYGVRGIPFIVVLDKEGKIVISHLNGEALEEKVDELFK